jgi:hypothetical protein
MSGVVYKVNCNHCAAVYIGQTKNKLIDGMTNHKNDMKNHKQNTALSTHAIDKLHTFNLDNAKILTNETNLNKRLTLEMLHIKQDCNSINFVTDTQYLGNIYNCLF